MQNILDLSRTNKLILAAFAFVAVFALGSGRAHAATLTVGSGCTINDAIDSVNAGTGQASCGGSSYGTSDTINIPAGTQTLSSDITEITTSVKVVGAGMGATTINGDGQYRGFSAGHGTGNVTFSDMKITAFQQYGIITGEYNVILNNIEVDGQDSPSLNGVVSISSGSESPDTFNVNVNNLYMHNINSDDNLNVFSIVEDGGGTINATLDKITIADIHTTGSGKILAGFNLAVNSTGTVNSTITNATLHDITGEDLVIPFGSFGIAGGNNTDVSTKIYNITITGMRGFTGTGMFSGIKSASFYAGFASIESGDQADTTVEVTNSLLADNTNDGVSSNCTVADLTGVIGGTGTDANATIISGGHNISDDNSCVSFIQPSDQQNINNIISTLGSLQNNGGAVPTRALLAGSPAISSGGAVLGVTTDARGIARPESNPSVGAYQYVAGASTSTPASGGGTSAPNTGVGSDSILVTVIASLSGLLTLGYSLASKRS